MKQNDHQSALKKWWQLVPLTSYRYAWFIGYKKPNPASLKYWLHQKNLITSSEVRLPLVNIPDDLKREIYHLIQ